MRVHHLVSTTLASLGVDRMFGLMGDANMHYITDFQRLDGGQFIACAHEASAVSMADGFARATRGVGVCTVTYGPAITNTLTALTEAVRARTPLLLVTGSTPSIHEYPQDIDVRGLTSLAGAGHERVHSADTVVADVVRAFRRALSSCLPVVLDVPGDLLQVDVSAEAAAVRVPAVAEPAQGSVLSPDPDAVDEALGLALSARRPIVLAGRGAADADARGALIDLAESLGAPLATSVGGKDLFAGHPDNLGLCGGVATSVASEAIAASDCVLAFGAGLNAYTADEGHLLGRSQRIVHCDVDAGRIGRVTPVEVGVRGDARAVAVAMLARLSELDDRRAPQSSASLRAAIAATPHEPYRDRSTESTIDLRTAMIELDRHLPQDRLLVTDVGRSMFAPWKLLHVRHPHDFFHTTGFSSLGLGLATAMGVSEAHPDRLTVVTVGDGGLMMSSHELHTAVRRRLPLLIVVANDGAYGAEWGKLIDHGVEPEYSLTAWPDLLRLAGALDLDAHRVGNREELDALAPRLRAVRTPTLLELRLDPTVETHL